MKFPLLISSFQLISIRLETTQFKLVSDGFSKKKQQTSKTFLKTF